MSVHCIIEGVLPCSSVRSTSWQGEWLFIGTDCGSLKTLKIPPVSPLPGIEASANTGSIRSEDAEVWHTQCLSAHSVSALTNYSGTSCFSEGSFHHLQIRSDRCHCLSVMCTLLQGPVCCVSADAVCGILATGDSDGNIRIWEEAKGQWNQLSSFRPGIPGALVGLQWVPFGGVPSQISLCLLHDGGHLLCVALEGQQLWSRDVKKACSCFCASPNGTGFVLASNDGEMAFHDSRGIYIRKLGLKAEAAGQEAIKG